MPYVFNPFTGTLDTVVDLSGYVPYTGATTNVNLGTRTLTAQSGTFSSLTSGRVPFATTAGLLTDASDFGYNTTSGITSRNAVISDNRGSAYPSAYDTIQGLGYGSGGYGTSNIFAVRQKGTNHLCAGMDLAPWVSYPYGLFNAYGDSSDLGAGYVRFLEWNVNDRAALGDKRMAGILCQATDTAPRYSEFIFWNQNGYQYSFGASGVDGSKDGFRVGFSYTGDGLVSKAKLHVRGGVDDGVAGTTETVDDVPYAYASEIDTGGVGTSYGQDITIYYLAYAYKTAGDATVFYSATPYSFYVYIGYSYSYPGVYIEMTLPDGADGIRLLRSLDGGMTYDYYYDTPSGVITDDNGTSFSWTYDAAPTVTPGSPYTWGAIAGTSTALRTELADVKFIGSDDATAQYWFDRTNNIHYFGPRANYTGAWGGAGVRIVSPSIYWAAEFASSGDDAYINILNHDASAIGIFGVRSSGVGFFQSAMATSFRIEVGGGGLGDVEVLKLRGATSLARHIDDKSVTSMTYDGSGNLSTFDSGDGSSYVLTYDGSGNLDTVVITLPTSATITKTFSYDGSGNLTDVVVT